MSDGFWLAIGWIGNACYFSRFLVQWVASERAQRSVAPRIFWWFSLAGALFLFAYTLRAGEPILLLGYVVTTAIYVRNLIIGSEGNGARLRPATTLALALGAWGLLVAVALSQEKLSLDAAPWLVALGLVGQSIWSSRFLVQWWFTERQGRSHFPIAFWWISLLGNALLVTYAISTGDPVWIAGLAFGPIVQSRNLWLAYGESRARERATAEGQV